jgi:K+-transporting ATPase KdpF subunit
MTALFWLAGLLSAALLVFLFVALLAPEALQ